MTSPVSKFTSLKKLIDAQVRQDRPGANVIVDRLTEVLLIQLISHYILQNDGITGFFAALLDRRIQPALKLINQEPGFPWSLAALGERLGMSRATLVRRFENAGGMPPMKFIMTYRIMRAYDLVRHTNDPLERIARAVGFASTRTLTKAFQRQYGCTPYAMRRIDYNIDN